MATTVRVNVVGSNPKWRQGKGWYEGDFVFQQVDPTPDVIMDAEGNVNLVTDDGEVDFILSWNSPWVQNGSLLYPTKLPANPEHAIWITKSPVGKPGPNENPPIDNGEIEVTAGPGPNEITLKDLNSKPATYTYCFAVQLTIGTQDFWFVTDPKITNRGNVRLFRREGDYQSGE